MELSERGNIIDQDLSVTYAIDIFLDQFFLEVESADNFDDSEILQDLDLLFLTHITDGKYKLKDKYVIRLIPLMVNRTPQSQL
ncbi:hypothetical protein [Pedobacter yonginense]|nr:hypothetical protein [Pedobacter yonginense]